MDEPQKKEAKLLLSDVLGLEGVGFGGWGFCMVLPVLLMTPLFSAKPLSKMRDYRFFVTSKPGRLRFSMPAGGKATRSLRW